MDPYEKLAYEGKAIPNTHPDRHAVAAMLRGIPAAIPEHARVLELGSATARNLAPMAFYLPKCRFVGVEIARMQHELAVELKQRLALDNLDLICADIMDLPRDIGRFDYIMAHGVYSWVPPVVRAKIFEICRDHLTENGVAYISFNAMPGWSLRGQVRQIMLLATRMLEDPKDRIASARGCLEFLSANVPETPIAVLLKGEIDYARKATDSGILYDYLSEYNDAFDAETFLRAAGEYDLAFLAELIGIAARPDTSHKVRAALTPMGGDDLELERMTDFLAWQQFRATLLARKSTLAAARPAVLPDVRVLVRARAELSSLDPILAAALGAADEQVTPPRFEELCQLAFARLVAAGQRDAGAPFTPNERADLFAVLAGLAERRLVELTTMPGTREAARAPKPRANELVRTEAMLGNWVTTERHRSVSVSDIRRRLLIHANGERDVDALSELLAADLRAGVFSEIGARLIAASVDRGGVFELATFGLRK
jgi:hypothetical protein